MKTMKTRLPPRLSLKIVVFAYVMSVLGIVTGSVCVVVDVAYHGLTVEVFVPVVVAVVCYFNANWCHLWLRRRG